MFDPSESTIQLYKELDGSYTFQLRNFSLMGGMMPVGTIILKNLNVNGNKITTSQKRRFSQVMIPVWIKNNGWGLASN